MEKLKDMLRRRRNLMVWKALSPSSFLRYCVRHGTVSVLCSCKVPPKLAAWTHTLFLACRKRKSNHTLLLRELQVIQVENHTYMWIVDISNTSSVAISPLSFSLFLIPTSTPHVHDLHNRGTDNQIPGTVSKCLPPSHSPWMVQLHKKSPTRSGKGLPLGQHSVSYSGPTCWRISFSKPYDCVWSTMGNHHLILLADCRIKGT